VETMSIKVEPHISVFLTDTQKETFNSCSDTVKGISTNDNVMYIGCSGTTAFQMSAGDATCVTIIVYPIFLCFKHSLSLFTTINAIVLEEYVTNDHSSFDIAFKTCFEIRLSRGDFMHPFICSSRFSRLFTHHTASLTTVELGSNSIPGKCCSECYFIGSTDLSRARMVSHQHEHQRRKFTQHR
jgi:hypothetical protein